MRAKREVGASGHPTALRRWLRFNLVGAIGVAVQLACVELLTATTTMDYRVATLAAVEVTLLHNFCWHLRFTWRERKLTTARLVLRRLMEFHLTNGTVSLAGTWTLMTLLVSEARVPVIAANMVSIVACSVVNFLMAEVLVFRSTRRGKRRGVGYLRVPNGRQRPKGDVAVSFVLPWTYEER